MIEKKHKKEYCDYRSIKSDKIYKSKRNRGTKMNRIVLYMNANEFLSKNTKTMKTRIPHFETEENENNVIRWLIYYGNYNRNRKLQTITRNEELAAKAREVIVNNFVIDLGQTEKPNCRIGSSETFAADFKRFMKEEEVSQLYYLDVHKENWIKKQCQKEEKIEVTEGLPMTSRSLTDIWLYREGKTFPPHLDKEFIDLAIFLLKHSHECEVQREIMKPRISQRQFKKIEERFQSIRNRYLKDR